MEFIACSVLAGVFSRFVGETGIVDPLCGDEFHPIGLRNLAQPFFRPLGAGAFYMLRQVPALGRRVKVQIKRPPLHLHLVFRFQLLDHTLADVTPRSDVIGENGQFKGRHTLW